MSWLLRFKGLKIESEKFQFYDLKIALKLRHDRGKFLAADRILYDARG